MHRRVVGARGREGGGGLLKRLLVLHAAAVLLGRQIGGSLCELLFQRLDL